MALDAAKRVLPSWKNAALALLAAGLLILSFPDFEYWFLAWFALVPLMWAVERETSLRRPARSKGTDGEVSVETEASGVSGSPYSVRASETIRIFLLGWLFGTAFFFGTCWWLTYAPIHYAAFPWPLAYFLILIACLGAGIFPGIFAAVLSILLKRFGSWAFLAAPFVWVFSEFLRYWLTGNNWNAIGYSQSLSRVVEWASIGGVLSVSFVVVFYNVIARGLVSIGFRAISTMLGKSKETVEPPHEERREDESTMFRPIDDGSDDDLNPFFTIFTLAVFVIYAWVTTPNYYHSDGAESKVIAIQPNVPMSGIDYTKLGELRQRQFDVAEDEIRKVRNQLPVLSSELPAKPITVVLPESPMNFMYNDDREFRQYVRDFTTRNNVSILFNSAEPDATNGKYFNSAMLIGTEGKPIAQYDKIYLLPFGEAVPVPFESILPAFVGNFSYGREYDLLPLGEAKAGVMICFESHFGQLSRRFVADGADVIIEMTNDGYLGPTPVLRQHLANAVFRAVETNRPVLRVTNVGITTYIDERGNINDPLPSYVEGVRVWTVSKSDGSQTFYVRYGDWFAWLCSMVTLGFVLVSFRRWGSEIGDK